MRGGRKCVLFDLDGTLIDSAPDLAGAANDMRELRGLAPLAYDELRRMAGAGARGMLGVAFGIAPSEPGYELMKEEFLRRYEERMLHSTRVFEHVLGLLDALNARQVPWGVVTNKASRFTLPLVAGLAGLSGSKVVVSGDTTPHSKPHPAPLLAACGELSLEPAACLYVGDDLRDMQAAQAAGMGGVAAAWGYLGASEGVHTWPCEVVCADGGELLNWLGLP